MAGIWNDPTSHVNGLFRGMRIVNWGTVFWCVCWAWSTGLQACVIGIYWEIWCNNSYPHQKNLLSRISMDPEFRHETVPYASRIFVLLLMFWKPCWNSSRCGLVPQLWPGSPLNSLNRWEVRVVDLAYGPQELLQRLSGWVNAWASRDSAKVRDEVANCV